MVGLFFKENLKRKTYYLLNTSCINDYIRLYTFKSCLKPLVTCYYKKTTTMIQTIEITDEQKEKILLLSENHFNDLKSKDISPASLTKTISAFSNL